MRLNQSPVEWVVGVWAVAVALVGLGLMQHYLARPAAPPGDAAPPAATTPAAPLQSRPAVPC